MNSPPFGLLSRARDTDRVGIAFYTDSRHGEKKHMDSLPTWEERITTACREAGTFGTHCLEMVRILADILERREDAKKSYRDDGCKPFVVAEYRGSKTYKKHPAVTVMQDCEKMALSYFKELGISPAGAKAITGKTVVDKKDPFAELLKQIEGDADIEEGL